MYPVLFRIGNFPINTYGVFLALAFLCAILITVKLGERDGLPRQKIYDLSLWMLLASLIGSKILMFFTEPEYRDHPVATFVARLSPLRWSFYGGLLGAVLTGYFLMRRYKLPWWKTADACAPGIAIGNFFGRQGCFAAGCCWGKPTNLPWGVKFTELGHEITGVPIDVPLHPTQLYESFSMLIVFFFSAVASQTPAFQRAGDSLLCPALFNHSLCYRICAGRSAWRHPWTDIDDRSLDLANH